MNAVVGPLWSRPARQLTVSGQAIGIVLGVIGYVGTHGQHSIERQIVWLNIAVVGALVAGCAQAIWLLEGRRSVSLLRRRVMISTFGTGTVASTATIDGAVTVSGGRSYHDPACVLVHGKEMRPFDGEPGVRPCSVCRG